MGKQGEIGLEMKISRTRWDYFQWRTRCRKLAEMVRAREEEMHGRASDRCEMLALDGFRGGRVDRRSIGMK